MALTLDTNARIPPTALSVTTANPITADYTCGANAAVLVLMIVYGSNVQRTGGSPTYNSVTLTQAESLAGVLEAVCEVWYLLQPPTGAAYQISIPNTNTRTTQVYVASVNAASGYTCALDATGITETTAANPTVQVITTVTGTLIFACVGTGDNAFAPTARTGTSLYEEDIATYGGAAQYYVMAGSGTQNMTWTEATSDDYGAIAVAFKEISTSTNYYLYCGTGTFTETGNNANLLASRMLLSSAGAFALTGNNVLMLKSYPLLAGAGSFSETGLNALLLYSRQLWAGSGTYALTGNDAILTYTGGLTNYELWCGAGGFIETGNNAYLLKSNRLYAEAGAFIETGNDAYLLASRNLYASDGAFIETGNNALLLALHALYAEAGGYVETGNNALLAKSSVLLSQAGQFNLTGMDAIMSYTVMGVYDLLAGTGVFTLDGNNAQILQSRQLRAGAGEYVITGMDAILNYMITGGDVTPTDPCRIYAIEAESRNYAINAESRTLVMLAENRTNTIGAG